MTKIVIPEQASPTVYIADRDADVCESIQFLLNTEHLATRSFSSVKSLLQHINAQPPSCVIVDAALPNLDLDILLQTVKLQRREAQVILLGGNSEITIVVSAIKSGVSDYIEKPFLQRELIASVKRAIDQ